MTGENSFAIDKQLSNMTAIFVAKHGDFAVEKVDAESTSLDKAIDMVRSLPFLAEKKLVIIKDPLVNKDMAENIEQLLKAVANTTELVLVVQRADKRSAAYKLLQKSTTFEIYKTAELSTLIQETMLMFDSKGIKVSKNDINYLITKTGQDQLRIAQEVQKLSNYSNAISRDDIDALVHQSLQSKIFDLVDAVFRGDRSSSLRLYQEQRLQKVEPQAIFGLVVWQLAVVGAIATVSPEKQSQLSELGLSPFVVKKGSSIVRKSGKDSIVSAIRLLARLDTDIKSYIIDADYAMRYFISKTALTLN